MLDKRRNKEATNGGKWDLVLYVQSSNINKLAFFAYRSLLNIKYLLIFSFSSSSSFLSLIWRKKRGIYLTYWLFPVLAAGNALSGAESDATLYWNVKYQIGRMKICLSDKQRKKRRRKEDEERKERRAKKKLKKHASNPSRTGKARQRKSVFEPWIPSLLSSFHLFIFCLPGTSHRRNITSKIQPCSNPQRLKGSRGRRKYCLCLTPAWHWACARSLL